MSESDERRDPNPGKPGEAAAPDARDDGGEPLVDDSDDPEETGPVRPAAPSYPPPSLPLEPSALQDRPTPQPGLPDPMETYGPAGPTRPSGQPYGWPASGPGRQADPTTALPSVPSGPPSQPAPPAPLGATRMPGYAWPVIAALALVVGLLGGVLGGVAVWSSLGSDDVDDTPPISVDNGAAAPLKATNGSITAVAARLLPSTVQIQANGGAGGTSRGATGSGFVLDAQNHVITNNHVVADATGAGQLRVVDQNGTTHAAKIVGRSPVYDLAVLDVTGTAGMRPAAIGSSSMLRVGDTVVAIGSPLGLSSTVTSGIVSATDRPVTTDSDQTFINALQTDAAINPGNSGGPLVNLRGQVVGVNSAIASTGGSIGESGNIGVGFAIPMEQVRITAAQILATGKARYPVIGANVDTRRRNNGARVVEVPIGSPAAAGGLREGDVVTRVDGRPVPDGISLIVAIRSHRPGETISLVVRRDGRNEAVKVTLESKVG